MTAGGGMSRRWSGVGGRRGADAARMRPDGGGLSRDLRRRSWPAIPPYPQERKRHAQSTRGVFLFSGRARDHARRRRP
ncbi:hypothetical protein C7S16_1089 [Burkholderia thailandensis]|uniref:Uncharacterized protein n=1 Tax=Burkholderia thailandensis TaxID=57975 RepID=A0AAW9CY01_BURTH|nr:hypothetical protein [Burkholderia thailandensis]MDW9253938.1 hypothetical protein [Burkholderia thailandensis]